jgi:RND family efflux transporter MFP subunit
MIGVYMSCRLFLPALAAVLLAIVASSCARKSEAEPSPGADAAPSPTVAVAKVTTGDLANNLVLTAEFKPYQEVEVMAKVAGYIKEIRVDAGDRVKEGDLLATLEVPEMRDEIRRDQAAVDRSQADVQRTQDELERAKSAHEIAHLSYERLSAVSEKRPGLVAQQEIDDAHSKDLISEAQISAAKSSVAAAQQQVDVNKAELQKQLTLQEYTRVTAPFTGVITKRYADKGSMIQAGTASSSQAMPVVRLSQNGLLRLILPVPESAVPTVHIGQHVEVKVPTLNRSFPGTVARFADKLNLATRTMDTEVDVPNPSLLLIPGMYAEVDLTLLQHDRVLTLPVTAVDVDGTNQTHGRVMVVAPNNRVQARSIELGMETANRVEVRSGLNEGDMVVLSGRATLQAGQEVKPKLTTLEAEAQAK